MQLFNTLTLCEYAHCSNKILYSADTVFVSSMCMLRVWAMLSHYNSIKSEQYFVVVRFFAFPIHTNSIQIILQIFHNSSEKSNRIWIKKKAVAFAIIRKSWNRFFWNFVWTFQLQCNPLDSVFSGTKSMIF